MATDESGSQAVTILVCFSAPHKKEVRGRITRTRHPRNGYYPLSIVCAVEPSHISLLEVVGAEQCNSESKDHERGGKNIPYYLDTVPYVSAGTRMCLWSRKVLEMFLKDVG